MVNMNQKTMRRRPKIILVPYPAQGHVTPMLKLATALHRRGLNPVMVTFEYIHRQIAPQIEPAGEVICMSIPDGNYKLPLDFFGIERAMEENLPLHLEQLVRDQQILVDDHHEEEGGGGEVICMVVDLLASKAIEVGRKCGLLVAGFWPAMFATYQLISSIPELLQKGFISDTGCSQFKGPINYLPNQPTICVEELPWLIGTQSARKSRFKFWTRTLARSKSIHFLLVNSFADENFSTDHHHKQQSKVMVRKVPQNNPLDIFSIGPLTSNEVYNLKSPSFWEEDKSCLQWLDKQSPNSVVYVSFGSWVSPISEEKVQSLAIGLEASSRPFIWVLKSSWREGLPVGYLNRVSSRGRVVSWAPQMDVLKHKVVGCFLTHCGWNSTMEAIQCKKPLLCFPVAGDQFLNCNFIVDVWKVGVKLNGLGPKEIEDGLKMVMEECNGDMEKRLNKVHERTMSQEASSRAICNIEDFVDDIKKLSALEPAIIGEFHDF